MKSTSAILFAFFSLSRAAFGEVPQFAEQVQPIFQEHCYACHGPETQESNYRLDIRKRALGAGDLGQPIVTGNSDQSPLIRHVSRIDEDLAMPPDGEGAPLSTQQVAILKNWIDTGADWPDEFAGDEAPELTTDHWSFQPIEDHEPPTVASSWVNNSIDRFIYAKLKEHNLRPSQTADRVQLIRRIFLDNHGLPPSLKQVEAFVSDKSPDAYSNLVDEVLDSPRYGERWARHWLDVVRFGESTGYEVNRDRENAYHYRDYVISSLNEDKSYRDFVIEQLAGDVVGADVGTGFLVGGPYDMVKSPDINLTLAQRQDELADFVNTTATAFLGLTVGCARCHNHKFDPILQKDFYSMQAVFAGVQHGEREIAGPEATALKTQVAQLQTQQQEVQKELDQLRQHATNQATDQEREPVNFKRNIDRFEPVDAKHIRFTILGTSGGEPCIDEFEVFGVSDSNVALAKNGATFTVSGTLPGYKIHQPQHLIDGQYGNNHSWISNTPGGGWFQIELPESSKIERIEWGRDRTGVTKDRLATAYLIEVATEPGEWKQVCSSEDRKPFVEKESGQAFIARLPNDQKEQAKTLLARVAEIRRQLKSLSSQLPKAYIGTFNAKPEVIHRLYRGDPLSPRETVVPDALTVIGTLGITNDTPESQRRLALASWIANDQNPLTARVIVNRIWHYHFGTGLVATPSDFGKNGSAPSHPELLDWLSLNFMRKGWSMKWLHREILTSATYQQSSSPVAEALAIDADCRLLWRFPPRRLAAEAIRDCVLDVSGALEHRGGGPGFLLLDIDHENVHHYFPKSKLGPAEFRRMIYMTKIRQEQDAVFGVFDCPDGGQVIPDRSRSTTPLQALNLLNSDFVLQQSEQLAARIRKDSKDDQKAQLSLLFRLAFARPPTEAEANAAAELADQYDLAAVCRAILNSNEFLFLP